VDKRQTGFLRFTVEIETFVLFINGYIYELFHEARYNYTDLLVKIK